MIVTHFSINSQQFLYNFFLNKSILSKIIGFLDFFKFLPLISFDNWQRQFEPVRIGFSRSTRLLRMAPSVSRVQDSWRNYDPKRKSSSTIFPPEEKDQRVYTPTCIWDRRDRIDREERGGKIGRVVEAGMSRRRRRTHIHQGGPQADHYCGLSAVIEFKHQRRYYLTN